MATRKAAKATTQKTKKAAVQKLSRRIAKATGCATTDGKVKAAAVQPEPSTICRRPQFFGRKKVAKKATTYAALPEKVKDARRSASRNHWASLPEGHWHRVYRREAGAAWAAMTRAEAAGDVNALAAAADALVRAKLKRNEARDAERRQSA